MWHVSSRSGVATLRTAIHLLLTFSRAWFRQSPFSTSPNCVFRWRMLPGAVNYVLPRTFEFSSLQHIKLWSTCVLFRRSLRLELTSWACPTININSCLQAFTKDISTPADIAPSAITDNNILLLYGLYKCTDLLLIIIITYCSPVV